MQFDHSGNSSMQLKLRGFESNRYCCVLRRLLPVAVFVLCATPGSAEQPTQYYLPENHAITVLFRAVDPARAPINEHWLLAETEVLSRYSSPRQHSA